MVGGPYGHAPMNILKFVPAALLAAIALGLSACDQQPQGALAFDWPPLVNEKYPDLELMNAQGELVKLSSFEGQVLLIEPIGMT